MKESINEDIRYCTSAYPQLPNRSHEDDLEQSKYPHPITKVLLKDAFISDIGNPVFLTDLLDLGLFEEAAEKAKVDSKLFLGVC